MPQAQADGVSLYYEEKGSGKPLVFVHGIPTDYRVWGPQIDEFSKGRRALAYSRRYAFPNKREGDVSDSTIEANASDLKGLVESLGLGSVDLVGHSYGGFTAAFMAARNPGLVASLVLVEPAISTLLVEDAQSPAQMLSLLFRSPSVALAAQRFKSRSLKPSLSALEAGLLERAVELNVDGVEDSAGAFASMPDGARKMMLDNARTIAELKTRLPPFKGEIGKIQCRTLVVNGERSPLWLRRIGQLTAAGIRGSQSASISGARHFPHMENPEEFNGLLGKFLAG